jgi:hypothetical protein
MVREFIGEGVSASRKLSQHIAAKEILLKMIDAGLHVQLGIPCLTQIEARDYVYVEVKNF